MGRAILLLAAAVLAVATPAPASAHPVGVHVAPLRQAATTAVRPWPRAQRQDDAFTLVEAQNGAVVRSRPSGPIASRCRSGRRSGRPPGSGRQDLAGRALGTGRPSVATERSYRMDLAARTPDGQEPDLGRGIRLPPAGEPHARRPGDALVRRRRRHRRVAHTGRPVQRHRPDRDGRPRRAVRLVAFGLAGHQPNLPAGWSGGDQLAIHGTNAPSSLGMAASACCLRVQSTALGTLKRYLHPGTPVIIEA